MDRRLSFSAFFLIAVVAFLIVGYLLIPACALAHLTGYWDAGCERSAEDDIHGERARLEARAKELQVYIDSLEERLAAMRCTAETPLMLPDTRRGEAPLLPDLPDDRVPPGSDDSGTRDARLDPESDFPPSDPDGPDDLVPGDMDSLTGCWLLESEFEIRSIESGETRPFPEWNVCFEEGAGGVGRQVMRSDDGTVCEGDIRGSFNGDGALVLEEDDDLICDDGTEIFRRETTCTVGEDGLATCEAVQPRTGGRGTFALRRN